MESEKEGAVEKAARRIIEQLKEGGVGKDKLARMKYRVCREEGLAKVLKDHEIARHLRGDEGWLREVLKGKKVRGASGIYTVAVMTKPSKCPKDRPCLYCPGGVEAGTPQSYLGKEPALMRGLQTGFDPYLQVRYRIDQYVAIGHTPSKIHLIIMGGTFPAADLEYQEWFMTRCLQAMNDFPEVKGWRWQYLDRAMEENELAGIRCTGVTLETRPDWAGERQTDRMIRLGATLVEMGVQALDNRILWLVNRGHSVEDVVSATRILRDSGLKVGYHMMPGLPGRCADDDLGDLARIFEDPDFRPDYLKVYPTLVMEGTGLFKLWKQGEFRAMGIEEAAELIKRASKHFPEWVRVARIQRDVPAEIIVDGVKASNLRELVEERLSRDGSRCRCIRCREIGLAEAKGLKVSSTDPRIRITAYEAGGGQEEFISVVDAKRDLLIGFLRLRVPSERAHRREVKGAAIVRELHVYGKQIPVGKRDEGGFQHQGWGTELLKKAEISSEKHDCRRIVVLPGVGVREYYRKRGYSKIRSSPFMVKELR
ncbi:MAG: tRNA uridine(34) 5-carboxymethylaminomethyl modification radical SAM/GNAT enzyme Elp3 [Candidatus Methanosuratincola sp.]|jgi:elongator complex protein 3|nr:tRNA uridine(34) 5-carboxymethylaminomethyl modification radical SAM/GNAT enzyme Elp3 [Candidatus Methanosuratincola sp.]